MLGDMFLWLVANLKQWVIYFIKQALPPNISAGSVYNNTLYSCVIYQPHEVVGEHNYYVDFASPLRRFRVYVLIEVPTGYSENANTR